MNSAASPQNSDHDLIVLGTGCAGLVAALSAHAAGLRPLVLEKATQWGGTTAMSGGVLWLPDNDLMRRDGADDSPAAVEEYLAEITAQDGPGASSERRAAFAREAPTTLRFLAGVGLPFSRLPDYPDYESERPGARLGRCVEPEMFDGRKLGAWFETLRVPATRLPAFATVDAVRLPHAKLQPGAMALAVRIALMDMVARAVGRRPLAQGQALAARLMHLVLSRGIDVRLGVSIDRLTQDSAGRVNGVIANGEPYPARLGVVLCAGGFAANARMRMKYQGLGAEWSNASADDGGDAITLGTALGAATSLMDSAWWMPTVLLGNNAKAITVPERALPGAIMVDGGGQRYVDEAASYMIVGRAMQERHKTTPAVPSWLIADSGYFRRYITGIYPASKAARKRMKAIGSLVEADSVEQLAERCGFAPDRLVATIDRFNHFAATGVDQDFQRGASRYDRYWGDQRKGPNATMAPIERPPFVAIQIWPGDIGTNGGLLTDEHARVLDAAGTAIPGLWAAGNASASVMGRAYAGAGATLGAAAVFGYIAGQDAALTDPQRRPARPGRA